jgi:putative ABC transport system permease protein
VFSDFRYSFRVLWKSPGFSLIAIGALALAIAANTSIFAVVNAMLLRPLPFDQPGRLAMVWEISPRSGNRTNVVNPVNFLHWLERNQSFEALAAFFQFRANLTGHGDPEQLDAMLVTRDFFRVLRINPAMGRAFTTEEDTPKGPGAVLISHALWQQRFGKDPDAVGKMLAVNGNEAQVIGILPADFRFPGAQAEIFVPLRLSLDNRSGRFMRTVGRLREGASLQSAQADMDVIAGQLRVERPDFNDQWGINVTGLHEHMTSAVRKPLWLMLGAVGFVLLIACANLANLMLIRATTRRREFALRASLGASRWRIARQLISESLLISAVAGGAALLMAGWLLKVLIALTPDSIASGNITAVSLDPRVYLFTLAVVLVTAVLVGVAPALRVASVSLNEELKNGRGGWSTPARSRLRSALVVAEIALSVVLLAGAGLMIRSFYKLSSVPPGFEPEQTIAMHVSYGGNRKPEQRAAFLRNVLERISSIPSVRAAGSAHFLPLVGLGSATGFHVLGRPVPSPGDMPVTQVTVVSPGYFSAMAIPLLKGRMFDDRDRPESPSVVVINNSLARQFFPDEDPLGKRLSIQWGEPEGGYEIIGVTADVRQESLDKAPKPAVYLLHDQDPGGSAHLVIRTTGDPMGITQAVRTYIRAEDPNVPVSAPRKLREYVSESTSASRFSMTVLTAFATLALVLAALGVYGVMAYSVAQRTHEIGVRVALGAQRRNVLALVLKNGLALAGVGIAAGVAGALILTRLMAGLLFEVRPGDPLTLIVVSAVLGAIALLATWLPARRAMSVDPMIALRYE